MHVHVVKKSIFLHCENIQPFKCISESSALGCSTSALLQNIQQKVFHKDGLTSEATKHNFKLSLKKKKRLISSIFS